MLKKKKTTAVTVYRAALVIPSSHSVVYVVNIHEPVNDGDLDVIIFNKKFIKSLILILVIGIKMSL